MFPDDACASCNIREWGCDDISLQVERANGELESNGSIRDKLHRGGIQKLRHILLQLPDKCAIVGQPVLFED